MQSTGEVTILVVVMVVGAFALEWCLSGCSPRAREAEA